MRFKKWLESFVYHGSKTPIVQWDSSRHRSGYYPGFYAWPAKELAGKHGQFVYQLRIDDSKFYNLTDADQLKKEARKAGFPASTGSGFQDVAYLKSLGYKGIKRGEEYVVFDPEEWSKSPITG